LVLPGDDGAHGNFTWQENAGDFDEPETFSNIVALRDTSIGVLRVARGRYRSMSAAGRGAFDVCGKSDSKRRLLSFWRHCQSELPLHPFVASAGS
jgi:hypothetical protein